MRRRLVDDRRGAPLPSSDAGGATTNGMTSDRTPKRIQQFRGQKLPAGARSVARPSRWGNPYRSEVYGRTEAIGLYREHAKRRLAQDPSWLDPLKGHDLACYCRLDEPCHADVLLESLSSGPGWTYPNIFTERGISLAIRDGRPYIRYEQGEVDLVIKEFEKATPLARSQRNAIGKIVGQGPGFLICRHVPPGLNLDPITPEVRPDPIVPSGFDAERRAQHDHATDFGAGETFRLLAHLKTAHLELEADLDELALDRRRDREQVERSRAELEPLGHRSP